MREKSVILNPRNEVVSTIYSWNYIKAYLWRHNRAGSCNPKGHHSVRRGVHIHRRLGGLEGYPHQTGITPEKKERERTDRGARHALIEQRHFLAEIRGGEGLRLVYIDGVGAGYGVGNCL